jgi:hypothetical protein
MMHHIVYIPIAVFCAVAAMTWAVMSVIEWREMTAARQHATQVLQSPARVKKFRPLVIQGGLQPVASKTYFRAGKTPLRSGTGPAMATSAIRSFGG